MTIEYNNECNAMENSVGASGDAACQNEDDGTGDGGTGNVSTAKVTSKCMMSSQSDVLAQLVAQMEGMKGELSNDVSQESWTVRQNLQDLYTKIILYDLEYALDKKVEQDLWNTVFKQPITTLQMRLSDKKNPKRAEVQMNLSNLLEHSSGFYLQLLQEICATFVIDLPCRMYLMNSTVLYTNTNSIIRKNTGRIQPKRGSCACICQHCLVHLGDLARYRQQAEQARTYYHWAMVVVPTSGHPYNQLAILENQKGNLLSTIFYYARAMACKTPFPAATTNFEKLLARIKKDQLPSTARLGQQELTTCFLHYHGAIHLSQGSADIARGRIAWERFSRQFASQLSPVCHFDWKELAQMSSIQLFALSGAGGTRDPTLTEAIESLSTSLVSLIECFSHCLIQLQEDKLPRSPILPALALLCCWLGSNWVTLKGQSSSSALMTVSSMPNFVRLLNNFQKMEATQFDSDKAQVEVSVSLPEDNLLQGFQPLMNILTTVSSVSGSSSESNSDGSGSPESSDDMNLPSGDSSDVDEKTVFRLRLLRLMDAARSLVRHKLICYQQNQFSLLPQTSMHPPIPAGVATSSSHSLAGPTATNAMLGIQSGNVVRANGPVNNPLGSRNAVNVAMQSIIQQKQQQQQLQQQKMQQCQDIKNQTAQSSSVPKPSCGGAVAKQSQPGLLISAEIARSIQEHIAQVSKSEATTRSGAAGGPVSVSSHDGRRTPSGSTPVVAVPIGGLPSGAAGVGCSSSERRYLYNQNREQFQKDLPPRFARKAAAAAMAGGSGLLSHDTSLLSMGSNEPSNVSTGSNSSILSAVQRQPSAEQQPNSLPLARKESEPLYPTAMWYSAQFYMQPAVQNTPGAQDDGLQSSVGSNGNSSGIHSLGPQVTANRSLMEVTSGDGAFTQFNANATHGAGGAGGGPGPGIPPVAAGGVGMFGNLIGGPAPQAQVSGGPGMSMQVAAVPGRNPMLTHPSTTVPSSNTHVNPNQLTSMFPPPPRFPVHRHQSNPEQQPQPQQPQPQPQQQQQSPPHSSASQPQLHPHSGTSMNPGWLPDGNKVQPHPPSLMSGTPRPLPPPVGTRLPGPNGPRGTSMPSQHQRHNLGGPPNSGISGNGGGDSVDIVSRRLLSGNVQSLWASPLENLLQQQQRQGAIGAGAANAPSTAQFRFGAPAPQQSRSGAT